MQETTAETSKTVAPALKELLNSFLDYAGIFPPAKLSLENACANFNQYRNSEYSWMLHWLVLNAEQAKLVPPSADGMLSIVSDAEFERASSIETKSIVQSSKPVYCELLPGDVAQLDAIKSAGCFAKIRTGGLTAEAIPAPSAVAQFILDCAARRLPFKATAGLHHPIRASYPLTYETDAPHAVMHGFVNVLLASCFAWHGELDIEPIIAETNPDNFRFDERASWRSKSLSSSQISEARQDFIHSIGSCSFDEPVQDLQKLGLLPT